jgi:hypothetical protein
MRTDEKTRKKTATGEKPKLKERHDANCYPTYH